MGTLVSQMSVSTRLQRIAELAREAPERAFLSLSHYIDLEFLREAFRRTRKDGAPGIDGQLGREYEEGLDERLRSLLDRFKTRQYKAPPVRRVWIPKGDGKQRPLGLPTFEDKVLQRAVAMVLEAVYEQDFLSCSHGYRPGRSARTALTELDQVLMRNGGGWVLELDIRKFFDSLSHTHLRRILDQRVRDGVLRCSIDKWLAAGVMEGVVLSHPDAGTPQGGVISPLLANVYLHEVLDRWFERDIRPRLRGRATLVRYADDAVMVFTAELDARQVMAALPERFAQYGLTLHPDKTRLLEFHPPRRHQQPPQPGGRSFDFLGLTHHWARSRQGSWVVKRKTASGRFSSALKRISKFLRRVRHEPVWWQHQQLIAKLLGHYGYYGFPDNKRCLDRVRYETERIWRKWLGRRNRLGVMSWPRFGRLLKRYPLPRPKRQPWLSAANA
jgi:group II intron reverse transcriptase/maturase